MATQAQESVRWTTAALWLLGGIHELPCAGKVAPKFAPKAEPGVFLGYHVLPGGRFHGDFHVASLDSFRQSLTGDGGSVQIQRVKEVHKMKAAAFEFPLKPLYDKARRTISSGPSEAVHEFPGPSVVIPGCDPLEPPAPASSEGQEPAAEQGGIPPQADAQELEVAPQQSLGDVYAVDGGHMVFGQFAKLAPAGSTRPIDITPFEWCNMSKPWRLKQIAGFPERQRLRDVEAARRLAGPAMVVMANKHYFPTMPTTQTAEEHRDKLEDGVFPFNAAVARTVPKKEVQSNPAALMAVVTEWDKLRKGGCWDEENVQEWDDVAKAARAAGTTVHVGRIFEICVEKGAELARGDPSRKFKGRVV